VDTEAEWDSIRNCRAGSTAAFEPLVRTHEAAAFALAEALLGDRDDAADAVQEAFVRAYRSLHTMKEGSAFRPWFRRILRNYCLDVLRSPRARRFGDSEAEIDDRYWSEPTGSRRIEREELSRTVQDALRDLSPEHREVLVLKEIEELSYAEIADATGISAGTVASRLYHARAALRKAILARDGSLVEER
jgi:RNA polymerase sigma-70 factor, ECF subfamily